MVQYRIDKKSGNKLSVLGLGCMRFSRNLGAIDMKKAEALVMKAVGGGVNYFDTAYMYPGSEEALGTILARNKVREQVFIATKLPIVMARGRQDFDKFFDKELERLKTTYIDYYLMHMLTDTGSWNTLKSWGIEDWIAEKKRSGQIRQLGFSFHGSQDEFFKLADAFPWDMCQIQYNYSDENFQAGAAGLKRAAEKMPVIIMEPLLGGRLAGNLSADALSLFKKARSSLSAAAWGLNWLWNQSEVAVILSGMSSEGQLDENLRLADASKPGMLDKEDMEVYARVREVLNRSYKIHCTGCNYCMPCPRGVNIPGSFAGYNMSYSMGYLEGIKHYTSSIAATSEKTGSPSLCVKCGNCEKHCPQGLSITQNLVQVRRRMEPLWFRFVIGGVRFFLGRA
jgi:predicted aldo/keto reductase-like oxidoreductase